MIQALKPWLRAVKFGYLSRQAENSARKAGPCDQIPSTTPITFIIGCGRSGTTMLGSVLTEHPNVYYLFEPYHLWTAIDKCTDCINLFHKQTGRCLMDASYCSEQTRLRFGRLMLRKMRQKSKGIFVEKTPLNTMRNEYLDAIVPHARYICIVRDGVDICRSIARLAKTNTYKIAGKPTLNQWWGLDDAKWKSLLADGSEAGYYADEVALLEDHHTKGAYEWLVSLREVDRCRELLGVRLCEVTYSALTENSKQVLEYICNSLRMDAPKNWLQAATVKIHGSRISLGSQVELPPVMCEAFNEFQQRFGFPNRAVCQSSK